MSYKVFVDDNFDYVNQERRYFLGEFETFDEAVMACKKLVDRILEQLYKPGMTADELSTVFWLDGEDPFIIGGKDGFSAREYATDQIKRITKESK
jgi:hypothetical protein